MKQPTTATSYALGDTDEVSLDQVLQDAGYDAQTVKAEAKKEADDELIKRIKESDDSIAKLTPEQQAALNIGTGVALSFREIGKNIYNGAVEVSDLIENYAASWGAANLAGGVNPVWGEILVSGVLATDLDYLKDAINATSVVGTPGTHYSSNTTAHDEVTATTNTNTTQVVEARSYNSGENIATTETAANASWGAAALASGSPKVVAASASANQAVSGGAKV